MSTTGVSCHARVDGPRFVNTWRCDSESVRSHDQLVQVHAECLRQTRDDAEGRVCRGGPFDLDDRVHGNAAAGGKLAATQSSILASSGQNPNDRASEDLVPPNFATRPSRCRHPVKGSDKK